MTFFILFSSLKSPFYPFIFYIFAWVLKVKKAMFFAQKYVYKSSVVKGFAQHILCLDEFAFSHVCTDIIFLNK